MRTISWASWASWASSAILAVVIAPSLALAQAPAPDTTFKVTFGGFIDTYYAYDVGRPPTIDRSFASGATFTTQPARSNEFNVNLAYVEATLSGDRMRGRLALQVGTSVQSNYAGEPTIGTISGPLLARHIQEAYAGYQLSRVFSIDAGVFYALTGLESWASKDNPTYTRSLVGDYSPYYSSGVRAIWQATPKFAVRLDLLNGWQNISETNKDKGVGLRLDLTATPNLVLTYYNFFNGEASKRFRIFNGGGAKFTWGGTTLLGEVDFGSLGEPPLGDTTSTWWGFTAIARQQLTPKVALVGRVERYADGDQVNIATGLADPFRGNGASLGIDVAPRPRLLWRTEMRGFFADAPIFPDGGAPARRNDGFIVTSLGLAF